MEAFEIDTLAEKVADKLFKKLKGEDLVRREGEITNALRGHLVSAYKLGKLKALGVNIHGLNARIKRGEYTEGLDYVKKEGKVYFVCRRVRELIKNI